MYVIRGLRPYFINNLIVKDVLASKINLKVNF